ncbi:MAG: tetratricopeptide repeat protein [Candidatus Omnitrophica bacterium]|nr:tetratricopeptide repeat protein [Candidatus Omnitrophota bacterium]
MRQKARAWLTACLVVGHSWFGLSMVWAAQAANASAKESVALGVAHYILGVRYDLLGEENAAIREYTQSVRFDGQVFSSHLRLGMSYARQGIVPRAIDELTLAARINPKELQPHYFLALIYSSLNDVPKAVSEYEFLLSGLTAEDPRNIEFFSYLGKLYFTQGKDDKALAQFERVIALDPKNTGALYIVGSCYLDRGRRKEAIDLFKRCIAQDPMEDGCLNSLSYTYAEDGVDLDEALSLVNRALEIHSDYAAYLDTRGWVYYRKGLYLEALKDLSRAADLVQDAAINDHLGDVSFKLNNIDAAKKYWQESLALDPDQLSIRSKLESVEKSLPVKTKP